MKPNAQRWIFPSALVTLFAWLVIGLPFVYSTGEIYIAHEILGVKLGEWLLVLVTAGLWFATWRLVVDARDNGHRQLRAYVSLESGGIVLRGTQMAGSVIFRNYGNTGEEMKTPWSGLKLQTKSAILRLS